jgi:hypothetical protein
VNDVTLFQQCVSLPGIKSLTFAIHNTGVHLYLRADKSANFGSAVYNIPNADISPVIRLGVRLWKKY